MFIFLSSFIYSVLDIKNGPLRFFILRIFHGFGNTLIKIMKKHAKKKKKKTCFENIKTRKCRTLNILGHLFSEVPLRCWLHTHNHLNGANQQGGNMTSARWLEIRLSIRHIYSPSTATEEHTELSLLPRDRKTRRRKARDGPLASLELVLVIEARKGCNIAFLSAWAGSKQLLISFLSVFLA